MGFLKRNWKPLLFLAIGAAVMAGLVWFILYRRVDRGMVVDECITGSGIKKPIWWAATSKPINFYVREGTPDYLPHVISALLLSKEELGLELFTNPKVLKPLEEPQDPSVIFEVISDGSFDPDHPGRARHQLTADCEIRRVYVEVDGLVKWPEIREVITRHEISGHALGLDHDDFEECLTYRGGKVMRWGMKHYCEGDKKLIREMFKK